MDKRLIQGYLILFFIIWYEQQMIIYYIQKYPGFEIFNLFTISRKSQVLSTKPSELFNTIAISFAGAGIMVRIMSFDIRKI